MNIGLNVITIAQIGGQIASGDVQGAAEDIVISAIISKFGGSAPARAIVAKSFNLFRGLFRSRKTVDLFRAVGVREFEEISKSGQFIPGGNSLEGRQFAFTLEEALKYAETDLSKVAVIKVTVEEKILKSLDFSKAIDPHIFENGVITVQQGIQSELFHKAIESIRHVF